MPSVLPPLVKSGTANLSLAELNPVDVAMAKASAVKHRFIIGAARLIFATPMC
jgi:hypothetical protein